MKRKIAAKQRNNENKKEELLKPAIEELPIKLGPITYLEQRPRVESPQSIERDISNKSG